MRTISGAVEYRFNSDQDLAEALYAIGSAWDEVSTMMCETDTHHDVSFDIEIDAQIITARYQRGNMDGN